MSIDDDAGFGHVLSRRDALVLLGAAGAGAFLYAPSTPFAQVPPCVVVPAHMEGPYFVEERLNRSDIRSDPSDKSVSSGIPLKLTLRVSQLSAAAACGPLANAVVDIWQCDAIGRYSDVSDTRAQFDTRGKKFLRGHQVTNADGVVEFTTIIPAGIRGGPCTCISRSGRIPAARTDFSSQLYFDESVTDRVHAQAPYSSKGRRNTTNATDTIYRKGGRELMLRLTEQPRAIRDVRARVEDGVMLSA